MTRGRVENRVHLAPPAFDHDQIHGPLGQPKPWTGRNAFQKICAYTRTGLDIAIDRRRQLRRANIDPQNSNSAAPPTEKSPPQPHTAANGSPPSTRPPPLSRGDPQAL